MATVRPLPPAVALVAVVVVAWAAAADSAVAGATYGINAALPNVVVVDRNVVAAGAPPAGQSVGTLGALQLLLDAHPNTAVYLRRSRFEVVATGLTIRSNRSVGATDPNTPSSPSRQNVSYSLLSRLRFTFSMRPGHGRPHAARGNNLCGNNDSVCMCN